ncbi:MAG: hypothetical protein RhofKO_05140 [Rhodothermales bacterium]
MRIVGIILIILGILGFIFRGISYQESEQIVDLGPLEVETEQTKTIPVGPVASGAAVVAGLVLVVVASRKPS